MKKIPLLFQHMVAIVLATLISVDSMACTLAGSTWKKVDSVIGGGDTTVSGAASFRRMTYLVGSFDQSGGKTEHWIVRRSSNRGESWTTVDDYSIDPGVGFAAKDVAVDPRNGTVYVVGGATEMAGGFPFTPWVVRRSRNQGNTWTTVDTFTMPSAFVGPTRVAVDGRGVIYVVGAAEFIDSSGSSTGEVHGIIRRSTNFGSTWTTIDLGQFTTLSGVAATADGKVFVAGSGRSIPGIPPLNWLVAYSPDGVSGWSIVDNLPEGFSVTGAKAADDGRVVVFGDGEDGTRTWLVRQAMATAPSTWETIDRYRPLDFTIGFGHARAEDLTFAQDGDIYSVGYIMEPTPSGVEFRVRYGHPPATLFIDALTLAWWASGSSLDSGSYRTSATTTTYFGDIITANRVQSGTTTPEWNVMKLDCK